MDARQFAGFPEGQRRREIERDLNRAKELERHFFRNRREVKEAIWLLIEKSMGNGFGFSKALIEQSGKLQIDDPKGTEEFEFAGGRRQWLEGFWNASFESSSKR